MMFFQFFLRSAVSFLYFCSFANVARAGAVTGLSESNSSVNCDERRSNADTSWCTAQAADFIYNQCYVIVRSATDPQSNKCDWQSCGPVAFVGSKAKINAGAVIEYGLSTPHSLASNPPSSWNFNPSTQEALPKFPFPRNYLTIGEFAKRRSDCLYEKNNSDAVQSAICPISRELFESNSYFACVKRHRPLKIGNNL